MQIRLKKKYCLSTALQGEGIMDLNLPEKKLVASLLEQPQTIAIEIRIDRIDLSIFQKLIDEDMVLWVQFMDLPSLEMLPYQRDRLANKSTDSVCSTNFNTDQSLGEDEVSVKLTKKSSALIAGEPNINKSEAEMDAEVQRRKLRDKRKTVYRKEKIQKLAKKHEMMDLKVERHTSLKGSQTDFPRNKSGSRSLSFKLSDIKKPLDLSIELDTLGGQLLEITKGSKSKDTLRDEEGAKKFRLLTKFLAGAVPDDVPEGIAFNSDCCILIPCTSVANILYKMDRMPLIIYVMELSHSCTKVVGKMCFPMNYCFQEAVVKAAKLKGGVVTHAVQQSFPIYKPDSSGTSTVKVGYLFGSISIVCYGRFGVTEIKSPGGDLMSGRLREWRTEYRDLSQGLGGEEIDLDEQPYGFKPTITRNTLPPPNGVLCPSTAPTESMFDFIQNFRHSDDKTLRLQTLM